MIKLDWVSPSKGSFVLAAVSGGADSVAMLSLLKDMADKKLICLHAAHFEHGIRGAQSLSDAAFVRDLCAAWRIPYHEGSAAVPELAKSRHTGLEQAARDARYAYLRQVKMDIGADCIALAHHLDDQAETVLMHLLRGAGLRGVSGMAVREGDLYRPLLSIRKAQLHEYLREQGIAWREDATNGVPDTPRNHLRLIGLPALERAYPGAVNALGRFSSLAGCEDDYMAGETDRFLEKCALQTSVGWRLESVFKAHPAIVRRAVRRLTGLDYKGCMAAAELYIADKGGKIALENGLVAERTRSGLFLLDERFAPPAPVALPMDGTVCLERTGEIKASPSEARPVRDDPYCQILDRESLEGACVRTRRAGDVIRPLGMNGEQKLSDYFINRRIERPMRDATMLLAQGNSILWVVGVGISQEARLRKGSRGIRLEARHYKSKWRKEYGDAWRYGEDTDQRG